MSTSLRRRLLNDIAELQQDPYSNVYLHINDANFHKACLILTPEDEEPLHLTIEFPHDYPLRAPEVSIQTRVIHPNVFGSYICASILNTTEGWTPAYTLKGIVIQLLSFFCSDELEQDHYGGAVNIAEYRRHVQDRAFDDCQACWSRATYICQACEFGNEWEPQVWEGTHIADTRSSLVASTSKNHSLSPANSLNLTVLPREIILHILEALDTRDILVFQAALPSIRDIVVTFDCIRLRELHCFCLKRSIAVAKLGIGVAVKGGRHPVFQSEFDLLSQEAFFQHKVRRSIQGVPFHNWLPLPLSRRHWNSVKPIVTACLKTLHDSAKMNGRESGYADVLYHFMNSVVVQFSQDAERGFNRSHSHSTLSHASEKAIEAYFGLFHLLLCIATDDRAIVVGANRIVSRFLLGPRSKTKFPDLGHVLVAALISDAGLTEELTFRIIKEAILRNVVWILDGKGAGMAELAYLEPSAISDYRLVMTFSASRTSYRLLMFLKLFSSAVRQPGKSLVQVRDALFDTHSAPPPGTSTAMAQCIRDIHKIDGFPKFLTTMGLTSIPSKSEFTTFLRRTINDSVKAGYSRIPMTQSQLYMIRKKRERNVEKSEGIDVTEALKRWYGNGEKWYDNGWHGRPSFFPVRQRSFADDGKDQRSGQGQRRGHGRRP